jgi:16S rRNA (uracil1498-N3)-methyltransferase
MRIFHPELSLDEKNRITVKGENFNYLKNVLRAREGEMVTLFDGRGRIVEGEIKEIKRTHLTVGAIKEIAASPQSVESPVKITLLQGLLKGQKMDLVVQKAAELGVSTIQPLITGRTEVRETRKVERWRKIAQEAARQCGRLIVPEVKEPVPLKEFFAAAGFSLRGILFWEEGGRPLKEIACELKDVNGLAVAIGPEGGFGAEEAGLFRERGFHVATLGPRILRAETAAIAALSLAQFLWGDAGGRV